MTIRGCYFRVPSPHREQISLNQLALGLHNYAKGSAEKSCLFHYCFDFLSYRLIFREVLLVIYRGTGFLLTVNILLGSNFKVRLEHLNVQNLGACK